MDLIGEYEASRLPKTRELIIDALERGSKKHYVKALIELDVTTARRAIRNWRKQNPNKITFLAWITKCISRAVSEHEQVHGIVKRNKLFIFKDIDISIIVETEIDDSRIPLPYVIRRSNDKTIEQINDEIAPLSQRGLKNGNDILNDQASKLTKRYLVLPKFIRKWLTRRILSDPFTIKKVMGTVMITSVGIYGKFGGWAVPISVYPLSIALGDVVKKPGVVGNAIEIREFLHMTVCFDHDAVDGAPCARFIATLSKLVERGYGLENNAVESAAE